MERFTNNRDEFLNQIKIELLEYENEEDWKEIFSYVELPFFLRYAWSYNWSINVKKSKYKLLRREWNAEYDLNRFDKGIYSLARLAIREKEIPINQKDKKYLNSIDWKNIDKINFDGIVLDGLICELRIGEDEKSINWNYDSEMNQDLNKLVYTMRNWKREMKEL